METTQLALLALFLGVAIGGSAALVVVIAFRARDRQLAEASIDVPDGVRDVLAGMDDAAIVVDASGTVRAASVAAGGFGMNVGEAISDEQLRTLARAARAIDTPGAATLTLKRALAPAEPRLVSARAIAITGRLVLIVVRDITERERVEQMRRDFVANTSHELKTPVGAVSLLSEAIESAADDPEQVRIFARRLNAEASRLSSLTSRIMNLSRLQAADELANVRDVSVDEIVTGAMDAHMLQADVAGVEIARGGTRGLYVRGDAQILSEALGNLVANAIAYSPRSSRVGVGVKLDGDAVEISVTDRGIGMSDAEQERVFERFYRADQARSRRTGGTGLGLSIVKHAVQRHGGEVRLWSRPGKGSTFTISLPSAKTPDDIPEPRKARKKKTKVQSTNGASL
ncbi:two-component system sensor histidine kinase SenX3 [Microbacterium halimionae]|uniref:Sensor-like histidine kinase SenX3 n=1 Tax=Microbacterium halimionae TaxID=1526413 RepID=A0A7W3PL91_9MICO|nr:ATP-binding protein [Microbacterium halimionae]MBA8815624.1 two-component system sensor histidine kinase SenX3 [Microbacterium halimionae]NII95671.1 two-component system sensor histidine kinase SenX3 [Microbacterium halimionae]